MSESDNDIKWYSIISKEKALEHGFNHSAIHFGFIPVWVEVIHPIEPDGENELGSVTCKFQPMEYVLDACLAMFDFINATRSDEDQAAYPFSKFKPIKQTTSK